ncbi:MAG: sigma-54-dependent Fis family transcriptional regulator [Deltaproteobacteria bacterium]|nr:MAG: sigma-54-dependent Fis family transcriptional regulator [Deltaproteobacteria bacterium]
MSRILVIDDNETMREGMAYTIKKMGHTVEMASGGRQGVALFKPGETDLVITDLKMDDLDGIGVIEHVKNEDPDALIIVVTAFGTIDVAVEAMQKGAFDFITKPFSMDLLRAKVTKALERRALAIKTNRLQAENEVLREELAAPYGAAQEIIGESEPMQRVFRMIRKVAATDSTVHIFGESGTGKELVARAVHMQSPRKDGPFIKVSCSALTETLLESELFGHEKGAFTNALKRKLGRFELADGGTLFLDEIGDISPTVQVKLLRVLQEREFERVGGEEPISVDVRIVSATNKNLEEEVEAGRFREDLFYRLHILPITLPPLRNRLDDLEVLLQHFLNKLKPRTRHSVKEVSAEVYDVMRRYTWPGNIRQLENVMEQILVLSDSETLTVEDLPVYITNAKPAALQADTDLFASLGDRTLPQILDDLERQFILQAFERAKGVKTETARTLGIKTSALYYKLEKYGIGGDQEEE